MIRHLIATILVLCLFSFNVYAQEVDGVKTIYGQVLKIKTDKPYPFPRKAGHTWMCKIKVGYIETDPDGDRDLEVYKAYPVNTRNQWMCKIPEDTIVYMTVLSGHSEYRGEILSLTIVQ